MQLQPQINVHASAVFFVFLSPQVWTYRGTTARLSDMELCSCNFTLSRPWGIITLLDVWTLVGFAQSYTCTTIANSSLSPRLLPDTSPVWLTAPTSKLSAFSVLNGVGWIFFGKRHSVSSWEIIDTFWLCAGSVLSFVCLFAWLVSLLTGQGSCETLP